MVTLQSPHHEVVVQLPWQRRKHLQSAQRQPSSPNFAEAWMKRSLQFKSKMRKD
uniref:Alternative protein CHD8 n=1 Tax=Homo sapiens TaxID=9606 RepID=L8E914_HUMAN|nr:alternative protein CHD8 [Homo sapiens]